MSNLKMPEMTYANLRKMALARPDKVWVPIAYQTWVHLAQHDTVEVKHHDTVIASLTRDMVEVTHRHYHTRTTANRLNAIVYANCGFNVGIKNGLLEIRFHGNGSHPLKDGDRFVTKK